LSTTVTKLAINQIGSNKCIQNAHYCDANACCRDDAAADNGCCTMKFPRRPRLTWQKTQLNLKNYSRSNFFYVFNLPRFFIAIFWTTVLFFVLLRLIYTALSAKTAFSVTS